MFISTPGGRGLGHDARRGVRNATRVRRGRGAELAGVKKPRVAPRGPRGIIHKSRAARGGLAQKRYFHP